VWVAITLVAAAAIVAFLGFCGWFFAQPQERQDRMLPDRPASIALVVLCIVLGGLSMLARL
jgi:hypothetical protein